MIETLSGYRFPLTDFPICSLGVRLAWIAERYGFPVQTWEEDGLGTSHGIACRVPSGRVFVLQELDHAVEHLGAAGPVVYVDVQEVVAHGVEPLVAEIAQALGLAGEALPWVQAPDAREDARAVAESAREYLVKRLHGPDPPGVPRGAPGPCADQRDA